VTQAGDGVGPAILAQGLVKRYDGRAVVDGLDLEVPRGSIVALLGPNGAGKTTTVEILEGYRRADAGSVRVLGLDPIADGRQMHSRIGLMLQDGGIQPQARPRELLHLYGRFFAAPRDPDELLATVGLETVASTRWRRLSGGERQRLSLALALVGRPELVLLDEPTAGMDPAAKATTRDLISGLRDAGVTVLMTTHELHDVERLADRIVVIDRGRLVAAGTPRELLADARPRLRLRLDREIRAADRADLADALLGLADSGVPSIEIDGSERYRIEGILPTPALVAAVAAWCAARGILPLDLRTTGATLEERYLELVGGQGGGELGGDPIDEGDISTDVADVGGSTDGRDR
jgi:ABC-2 type transport system ATP-binding protein